MSTGIACILILIQILLDKGNVPVHHSSPDLLKFSAAFGTIVFSVSGHPAFPTFIADMKKKSDFKWWVLVGYTSMLLVVKGFTITIVLILYQCVYDFDSLQLFTKKMRKPLKRIISNDYFL